MVSCGLDDAARGPVFDPAPVILSATTVDLARAQFATTSLYHFLFVPLTLGLGPIVTSVAFLAVIAATIVYMTVTHRGGEVIASDAAVHPSPRA
jgi:cytochrome d ubiquinol oxidase subunit I